MSACRRASRRGDAWLSRGALGASATDGAATLEVWAAGERDGYSYGRGRTLGAGSGASEETIGQQSASL